MAGNNENIGKTFSRNFFRRSNSHKYQEGVKYLHFFQNRKDIEKIRYEHGTRAIQFYVCEFDIPKKLMKKGIGRYSDHRGYEQTVEKAKEYILPAKELDCSWLKSYEKYESKER